MTFEPAKMSQIKFVLVISLISLVTYVHAGPPLVPGGLQRSEFEHEVLQSVDLFLAFMIRIVTVCVSIALGLPVLMNFILN